jgi:hypothetical protein
MKKCILNEKELLSSFNVGNITLTPYLVIGDGTILEAEYKQTWSNNAQVAHYQATYQNKFTDDLYFNYQLGQITCKRLIHNISNQKISLKEAGIKLEGITFNQNKEDDFYYHAENSRLFANMTFPVDFNRMAPKGKDPNYNINSFLSYAEEPCRSPRIGASPYEAFPAILLSNYNTNIGLVHGTLEQRVFYHCYEASHNNNTVTLNIISGFKGVDALEVVPNRSLCDRWYLGCTNQADDIEHIFDGYTKELRKVLPPMYGAKNANRHSVVWESWNDGIERDVSEEMMLAEAKFVSENFPNVRYVQLDDGYWHNDKGACGIGTAYEKDGGIDKKKFPSGLRSYSDKVREFGLTPAIWIGFSSPYFAQITQEHPEWGVDYGWRYKEYEGYISGLVLDPSIPEVREYIQYALDKFCYEYNFNGIKLDFWSYVFETSAPLLKNKEHSSYEWRSWVLTEIRKRLPTDGYFQTGCDIVQGNPFLGEFFSNYRYGLDVSGGEWERVKMTFLWGTSCFALHTGDLFVPNSDSIGIMPGLSDNERMFAINYILITHSFVELSGKLHSDCSPQLLKIIQKALCNINNGQDVHFAQYDYRKHNSLPPAIWYNDTPLFSRKSNIKALPLKTIALFNLRDEDSSITIKPEDFNLEKGNYILTDVWSNEQWELTSETTFTLPKHSSILFTLNENTDIQIFDSNIRLEKTNDKMMSFATDYGTSAEVFFSKTPSKIYFNDQEIEFTTQGTKTKFEVPDEGILTFEF